MLDIWIVAAGYSSTPSELWACVRTRWVAVPGESHACVRTLDRTSKRST